MRAQKAISSVARHIHNAENDSLTSLPCPLITFDDGRAYRPFVSASDCLS